MRSHRPPTSSRLRPAACLLLLPALTLTACSVNDTAGAKLTSGGPSASLAEVPLERLDPTLKAELPKSYAGRDLFMGVNEYPPYITVGSDGKLTGLVPDLARQLSSMLGTTIIVNRTSFDEIVPGLQSGRYDLSAPTGDFVERRQQVDFTDFAQSSITVLVNSSSGFHPKAGVDLCGHDVGVEKGTQTVNILNALNERCATAGKPKVNILVYNDQASSTLALQGKRLDAVAAPRAANAAAATSAPDQFQNVEIEDLHTLPGATAIYAFETRKNGGFAPVLADALHKLRQDGIYTALFRKWGLTAAMIDESQITVNGSTQHQTKQ